MVFEQCNLTFDEQFNSFFFSFNKSIMVISLKFVRLPFLYLGEKTCRTILTE